MSSNVFRQQVEAGAKLLDEKVPGWMERIDLEKLDVSDTCDCVIGQVFFEDPYTIALMDLLDVNDSGTAHNLSHDYGFAVRTLQGFSYEDLTREWKEYIVERRG